MIISSAFHLYLQFMWQMKCDTPVCLVVVSDSETLDKQVNLRGFLSTSNESSVKLLRYNQLDDLRLHGNRSSARAAADDSPPESLLSVDAPQVPDGAPVFVEEPQEVYYVVSKNKPLTLSCKAAPAVQINFKCAGQWVRPEQYANEHILDPASQVLYLRTSIEVDKDEVDAYLGTDGYWCDCQALNSLPETNQPRSSKSRRGYIHVACKYPICFWVKNSLMCLISLSRWYYLILQKNVIWSAKHMADVGFYTHDCHGRSLSGSSWGGGVKLPLPHEHTPNYSQLSVYSDFCFWFF